MENQEIYGKQVYTLTAKQAIENDEIPVCSYKILITGVTSEEVHDRLLSQGVVMIKGEEVRARQVANQLALEKAGLVSPRPSVGRCAKIPRTRTKRSATC